MAWWALKRPIRYVAYVLLFPLCDLVFQLYTRNPSISIASPNITLDFAVKSFSGIRLHPRNSDLSRPRQSNLILPSAFDFAANFVAVLLVSSAIRKQLWVSKKLKLCTGPRSLYFPI